MYYILIEACYYDGNECFVDELFEEVVGVILVFFKEKYLRIIVGVYYGDYVFDIGFYSFVNEYDGKDNCWDYGYSL